MKFWSTAKAKSERFTRSTQSRIIGCSKRSCRRWWRRTKGTSLHCRASQGWLDWTTSFLIVARRFVGIFKVIKLKNNFFASSVCCSRNDGSVSWRAQIAHEWKVKSKSTANSFLNVFWSCQNVLYKTIFRMAQFINHWTHFSILDQVHDSLSLHGWHRAV